MTTIGHTLGAEIPVAVDLHALRGTHMGVIANSGAGKSGLVRKILEVTHGDIQQIILDPDDEYYTLREGGDYIIAGGEDGDCPATPENAAQLVHLLLTTSISAVVQLNHLKGDEPQRFVAAFITALMEAPRDQWRPILLVIDEAHRFIPQDGSTEATEAVRDLFARGRKRGFTGIVATQRMASIEKMVTANINNWALGRVGQATDRKVVQDALGFTSASAEGKSLMAMEDRVFWMFGRGLGARVPVQMKVDDVSTTMVESGEAKIATAPAPEKLKKLLQELNRPAPAPKVAADAPKGPAALSGGEIEAIRSAAYREGETEGLRLGMIMGEDLGLKRALASINGLVVQHRAEHPDRFDGGAQVDANAAINLDDGATIAQRKVPPDRRAIAVAAEKGVVVHQRPKTVNGKISRPVQDIVAYYEAIYPRAVTFRQAAQQAGVGMRSSQFRTYEPEMLALGVVEDAGGGRYRALQQVGSPEDYLERVAGQLAPKHRAIFQFIRKAGRPVSREEIIAAADVSPMSSTTSAALGLLIREAEVVEQVGDNYQMVEAYR